MIEISPFFGQILTPIVTIFRWDGLPLSHVGEGRVRVALRAARTVRCGNYGKMLSRIANLLSKEIL